MRQAQARRLWRSYHAGTANLFSSPARAAGIYRRLGYRRAWRFGCEYSGAITGYFNAYIQSQLAAVSQEKAKGEADKAAEDARSAKAAADNAERLRVAEAEERVQLAKKAAFDAEAAKELAKKAAADAETAREVADNAAKLRLAEAEEDGARREGSGRRSGGKVQLAKKAAADAETARATADNSARKRLALQPRRKRKRKLNGKKTKSSALSRMAAATPIRWYNANLIADEHARNGE